MARTGSGMRDDILRTASRLFAASGYKGTSLLDIASEVGCSKASLLYHFAGKDAILTELLTPARDALAELDAQLAPLDGEEAARAAVDGFVDLVLHFRNEVKVLFDEIPEMLQHSALTGVMELVEHLRDALAGRAQGPSERVAAMMVIGAVPVVSCDDEETPDEELRAHLVRGALRTLDREPRRT